MIDRKFEEANQKAKQYVELLRESANSYESLKEVHRMQVPQYLKGNYGEYEILDLERLYICSSEMSAGEFRNEKLTKYQTNVKINLSPTEKLNIERGLAPRDRYAIAVDFTYRDLLYPSDGRFPFRDYRALDRNTFLVFEDVNGALLIAKDGFCGGRSPLGIVVNQSEYWNLDLAKIFPELKSINYIKNGNLARVNLPGDCLNLRDFPGLSTLMIGCVNHGETVRVLSDPYEVDGVNWVNVIGGGKRAWVSLKYLKDTGGR